MNDNRLSGDVLHCVTEMPALLELRLQESDIPDEAFSLLRSHPSLSILEVSGNDLITPAVSKHLRHVPKLKTLYARRTSLNNHDAHAVLRASIPGLSFVTE